LQKKFDAVIIDEASQAVEPSVLLPMSLGAKQVYLVGDHSQLPATVISPRAVDQGYNMGLFGRLLKAGYPVQRITTQYRMHPLIREFPSATFYGGLLKDGPMTEEQTTRHWHRKTCLGPIVFYDVCGSEKKAPGSTSILAEREAQCVVAVYLYFVSRYPILKISSQFGVISPYKGQIKLLRQFLSEILGSSNIARDLVDVNTLDGFQGREKDVVVFSVSKTNLNKSVAKKGFIADERRLNVGLTRARSSIIIVGNANCLSQDSTWKSLIEHYKAKTRFHKIHKESTDQECLTRYIKQIHDCADNVN
jgi:senataxin